MLKRATIVHINALVRVTPLVGGYLKAYALAEPEIRNHWRIDLYSTYLRTPASEIIAHLARERPDVVAFSTYAWNVGLVLRLLPALRVILPQSQFLLGGVELINQAARHVDATWDNVAVCNGEGEQTFRAFLLEIAGGNPQPDRVGGLSFARDGEWHATPPFPRIKDLMQIPSPWLEGMFDPKDMTEIALFETNRGCPFACEFCFWGGATGERVHKLETARIKEEISYIARHRTKTVLICDANFGMLARDIEIAEHIAATKHEHRAPTRVTYNSAKNNPDRVEQIARIFRDAGLLHHQAISLQTLNERALQLARRDNIKKETYLRLQRRLNEWGVPSFVELIWPLPGETLDSFKDGIDELCTMGAQSFMVHPLLWLNNVGYADKTEQYGVATLLEDDPVSSTRLVIQTNEVSFEECLQGLLFTLSNYLLYNCRGLYASSLVMNALGLTTFRNLFDEFVAFMNGSSGGDAITKLWHHGAARLEELIKFDWLGEIAYACLHSQRRDFDLLLQAFLAAHPDWRPAEHARLLGAAFEFDLLNRPYPYLHTPFEVGVPLGHLSVHERQRGIWVVDSPFDFPAIIAAAKTRDGLDPTDLAARPTRITINHRCRQVFQLPGKSAREIHWHMHQTVREIGHFEPACESRSAA
jgi:radical SAM superfamily enzyme YgiQ (UPF0313 family)